MILYLVYWTVAWEANDLMGVYSTKELAEERVDELIEKSNFDWVPQQSGVEWVGNHEDGYNDNRLTIRATKLDKQID